MGVLSSKDGSANMPDGSSNVDMQYSSNLHQDLYRRSLDGYDTVNSAQNDLLLSFNDGDPNHNPSNNTDMVAKYNIHYKFHHIYYFVNFLIGSLFLLYIFYVYLNH